jgi:hypothetical protein
LPISFSEAFSFEETSAVRWVARSLVHAIVFPTTFAVKPLRHHQHLIASLRGFWDGVTMHMERRYWAISIMATSLRREAADSTRTRIPPKPNQIKPSKFAWISLVLFVRIGTFQWVTREKIKKSTLVSFLACAMARPLSGEYETYSAVFLFFANQNDQKFDGCPAQEQERQIGCGRRPREAEQEANHEIVTLRAQERTLSAIAVAAAKAAHLSA